MYQYSYADQKLVDERVAQFRDQTQRFLAGELPEEQFLPLRSKTVCIYSVMRRCYALPFLMA